jgi:hypothetical protein
VAARASRGEWPTLPAWAWVAIALAAMAGAFWLGHRQGQQNAGYDAAASARERGELESGLRRLEAKNTKLNSQVAELEMARRLDREAYGQVERTLGELQSRLSRQGDDLAFYRSIVSPDDGVQGLRIQRFAVRPGTGAGEFVVELTLIQAMRQEHTVSGLAQVIVQGMEKGHAARYTAGELSGQPRARLPFSFRYFQTIERSIQLPDGFEPFEVEVSLQSRDLRSPATKSFPWKPAASEGSSVGAPADAPRGSTQ